MRPTRLANWTQRSLWAVLCAAAAVLGACSDNAEDPAAAAAAAQKMYETEYEPARLKYLELLDVERKASEKIIPLRSAMKSGNDKAKTALASAKAEWNAAKAAFETQKEIFLNLKAKLKAMNFDFDAAKQQ